MPELSRILIQRAAAGKPAGAGAAPTICSGAGGGADRALAKQLGHLRSRRLRERREQVRDLSRYLIRLVRGFLALLKPARQRRRTLG